MSECGKLAAALCQAQGEVGGVQKGSQNTHQRFNYTSIEEMVVATRGPLRRAGLVVMPTAHRVEGEVLVTEWLLVHTSGESMPLRYDMPIVPGKGRPMDKAASASASQALNYLLRDLLLLPRGEAEDIDGRATTSTVTARRTGASRSRRCPTAKRPRRASGCAARVVRWCRAGCSSRGRRDGAARLAVVSVSKRERCCSAQALIIAQCGGYSGFTRSQGAAGKGSHDEPQDCHHG